MLSWLEISLLGGGASGARVGVATQKCQTFAPEAFRTPYLANLSQINNDPRSQQLLKSIYPHLHQQAVLDKVLSLRYKLFLLPSLPPLPPAAERVAGVSTAANSAS